MGHFQRRDHVLDDVARREPFRAIAFQQFNGREPGQFIGLNDTVCADTSCFHHAPHDVWRADITAFFAMTVTRWARYSASAWISELRFSAPSLIAATASGVNARSSAASIAATRNTPGPAPVTATRTFPAFFATHTPTTA